MIGKSSRSCKVHKRQRTVEWRAFVFIRSLSCPVLSSWPVSPLILLRSFPLFVHNRSLSETRSLQARIHPTTDQPCSLLRSPECFATAYHSLKPCGIELSFSCSSRANSLYPIRHPPFIPGSGSTNPRNTTALARLQIEALKSASEVGIGGWMCITAGEICSIEWNEYRAAVKNPPIKLQSTMKRRYCVLAPNLAMTISSTGMTAIVEAMTIPYQHFTRVICRA